MILFWDNALCQTLNSRSIAGYAMLFQTILEKLVLWKLKDQIFWKLTSLEKVLFVSSFGTNPTVNANHVKQHLFKLL